MRPAPEDDARTIPLCFRDLRVSPDDLTTVGEALAACSGEAMLQAVMRHEAGWRIPVDAVGSRAHHMLLRRIEGGLNDMRSLEDAAVALAPSREGMVGPLFRFVADPGGAGVRYEVSAAAFSLADAAGVRELLASGMERVCTWDELRALRRDAPNSSVPAPLSPSAIDASAAVLSAMPWERVLALPLWLPKDLSEDERWAVLAKVFWSMTYRGFEPDAVHRCEDDGFSGVRARVARVEPTVLPADPLMAVLGHNCWMDTLEAWNALFGVLGPGETCL